MMLYRPVVLFAMLGFLSMLSIGPEAAPPKKPTGSAPAKTGSAGLAGAESLLEQAIASAEKDPLPEFGGHRAKAVKHMEHALKDLKAATKDSAKGDKGKGKGKGKDKGGNASGKGKGKGKGKDKDKGSDHASDKGKGKDKSSAHVAKAVKEMDHALAALATALKVYEEHHKGKGRKTGLHHAEKLVQQAKAAASSGK